MLLVGVPLVCWGEQLWTAYPWLEPVAAVLSALVVAVMFQDSFRREAESLLRQHWASLNGCNRQSRQRLDRHGTIVVGSCETFHHYNVQGVK